MNILIIIAIWILCGLVSTFIAVPYLLKLNNENPYSSREKMDTVVAIVSFMFGPATMFIAICFIILMKIQRISIIGNGSQPA